MAVSQQRLALIEQLRRPTAKAAAKVHAAIAELAGVPQPEDPAWAVADALNDVVGALLGPAEEATP